MKIQRWAGLAFAATSVAICEENKPTRLNANHFHQAVLEATVKIEGEGSQGSGVIIVRPNADLRTGINTLVTADHVFRQIRGEFATVLLRKKLAVEKWERHVVRIKIRSGSIEQWVHHPEVDLAGISIPVANDCAGEYRLTWKNLLDDAYIRHREINAGADLFCAGYPLGYEANDQGWAILRSGRIASFPLLPTKQTKVFMFDFTLFPGNSGGPVYVFDKSPRYGKNVIISGVTFGIMGIVTQEHVRMELTRTTNEQKQTKVPLILGSVIHASFINELFDSMKP